MNYYLLGQLFGKLTSFIGIGSFISGLIFKNHKFLLTSILFFTIIEIIITYIVFGIEVRDKSSNLFLIVFSGLIAGYLGFFIRSKFRKK